MKKVAILMPVYNRIELTKKSVKTLDSIISDDQFKISDFHIVVIDDGSTDGTEDWLKINYPKVIVLKGNGNLWWSGGINLGADYAMSKLKADFLLLWNNDIIPAKDYFQQLDNLLIDIDDETIAGSKIFRYDKERRDIIWSFGGFFNPRNGRRYLIGHGDYDSEEYVKPRNVDWLPGMGTIIPMNVLKKIGLWDEKTFPQYHGDSDYTYRAKNAGYNILVFPQLIIWNDKTSSGFEHGGSFKGLFLSLTDKRSNSNFKKNFLFYKRHSTSLLAFHVLIVYYMKHFGRFFKLKIHSLFDKNVDHK